MAKGSWSNISSACRCGGDSIRTVPMRCSFGGLKPIEFEKGKPAIAVQSLDKLPSVIDTLITAVRNGELDQQFAEASKHANPRKAKRAA